MEGGLLSPDLHQPYQQPQRMMNCFSSPPPWRTGVPPSGAPANSPLSMRQSLADLLVKEREETDRYLRLQMNRLMMGLHQQRKQHMTSLLSSLASPRLERLLTSKPKRTRIGKCPEANGGTGSVAQESRGGEEEVAEDRQGERGHGCVSEPHHGASPRALPLFHVLATCGTCRLMLRPSIGGGRTESGDEAVQGLRDSLFARAAASLQASLRVRPLRCLPRCLSPL